MSALALPIAPVRLFWHSGVVAAGQIIQQRLANVRGQKRLRGFFLPVGALTITDLSIGQGYDATFANFVFENLTFDPNLGGFPVDHAIRLPYVWIYFEANAGGSLRAHVEASPD